MMKLSMGTIDRMLHKETAKKEDLATILRSIYTRYMRLFEEYLDDLDGLNHEKIAEMRKYHEETQSLIKYYYMDIPQDICTKLEEFEDKCTENLLGPSWHQHVADGYLDFCERYENRNKGEKALKAEFKKQALRAFYDTMGYIFRDGFGTDSQTARNVLSGITDLFLGKDQ